MATISAKARPVAVILAASALFAFLFASCSSFNPIGMLSHAISGDDTDKASPPPAEASPPPPAPETQAKSSYAPSGAMYARQFSAIFQGYFLSGGYFFGGLNYKPGQGTTWTYSESKDSNTFTIERALLAANPDGSTWWYLSFQGGKSVADKIVYEFKIDRSYHLLLLRVNAGGQQLEYSPTPGDGTDPTQGRPVNTIDKTRYDQIKKGVASVTVKAGTFSTDQLVLDGTGFHYEWYASPSVPGGLVKFKWTSVQDNSWFAAELTAIRNDYVPTLGKLN